MTSVPPHEHQEQSFDLSRIFPVKPCAAAMTRLNQSSPIDPTENWIDAWRLLRKPRISAAVSAIVGPLLGVLVSLPIADQILRAQAGLDQLKVVVGVASMTIPPCAWIAYHVIVRTCLDAGAEVPGLSAIPRINATMAPFDGVAKEYIRRQNGHAS